MSSGRACRRSCREAGRSSRRSGATTGRRATKASRARSPDFCSASTAGDLSERNIAITNGSQSAFLALFNLLAGPDGAGRTRRVLLPLSPEYIGYADLGLYPGLFVSRRSTITDLGDGLFKYGVDFDGLDEVEDIGAICVSRPTNPTGNVVTDEEIERLGAIARTRGVPLIVDNAYGLPFPGIVYGDATLAWNEHTILCMSLSKLGMPGLRTGIVIANEAIISALGAANAIFCLAPGSLGPALASSLFESGEVLALSRDVIRPHYAERAHRAVDILRTGFEGCDVRIHRPEGAFFLWLWMPGLPIASAALYERLKAPWCRRRVRPLLLSRPRGRRLAAQEPVHPDQLRR